MHPSMVGQHVDVLPLTSSKPCVRPCVSQAYNDHTGVVPCNSRQLKHQSASVSTATAPTNTSPGHLPPADALQYLGQVGHHA
jgi:hypothetical protein